MSCIEYQVLYLITTMKYLFSLSPSLVLGFEDYEITQPSKGHQQG